METTRNTLHEARSSNEQSTNTNHSGEGTRDEGGHKAEKVEILVPLDGSPLAEVVLPHACSLARATSRGITLLRVVQMQKVFAPMTGAMPPANAFQEIWEAELDRAEGYMDHVGERLRNEGLSVETREPKEPNVPKGLQD